VPKSDRTIWSLDLTTLHGAAFRPYDAAQKLSNLMLLSLITPKKTQKSRLEVAVGHLTLLSNFGTLIVKVGYLVSKIIPQWLKNIFFVV
jgi:hypothetical protein